MEARAALQQAEELRRVLQELGERLGELRKEEGQGTPTIPARTAEREARSGLSG